MTTNLSYVIGNDNGNSEQEMIIDGQIIVQPNVNCEITELPSSPQEASLEAMVKNIHENLMVTVGSECIENKGTYFVGSLALNSGEVLNNMQVGLDLKYENDLPVINTLALIAGQAIKDAYAKNRKKNQLPEQIQVDVEMATALPVIQHNKENAAKFEDKFTMERHLVEVHLSREITVEVIIDFNFVKVLPESTIVTFALQKDVKGNLRSGDIFADFKKTYLDLPSNFNGAYFKDLRLLHVDIGDGTTEYSITEGNKFLPNFTEGSNNGVGHAIEAALASFNKEIHIIDSPRQFLSEVLKDEEHKYHDIAIRTLEKPLKVQENQIIRHVKSLITKARNEVDIIVVYGGGSIAMNESLRPTLENLSDQRSVYLLYVPAEYATNLGAEGLYVFATSKIFAKLREKEIASYEDQDI